MPREGADPPNARDELIVADLDFDMIREVRNVWQFCRGRLPGTYDEMVGSLP